MSSASRYDKISIFKVEIFLTNTLFLLIVDIGSGV